MKLKALKSVEIKGIEIPALVEVPNFADANKLSDRIFGAFCRINPELPCMEDSKFIKNVFTCIKSAGGKDLTVNKDLVNFVKTDKEIAKWRKWYAEEKAKKAEYRKLHKDEIKKEADEKKALYGTVLLNGVEEPLASWVIESEGIFFGRGDSPINGFWKKATTPSEVIVNTNSKNLPVLITDKNKTSKFDWNVVWEPNSHFAAQYNIEIGIPNPDGTLKTKKSTKYKMIQFSAMSSVKKEGQSKKYAAATELGKSYDKIIENVKNDFTKIREGKRVDGSTAVAVFMLFEKGIRIGFSGATVNGTKGLLALDWGKDVKRIDNKIKFDFYGKDSVRDTSSIETEFADVIEKVWSKYGKLATDKPTIKAYITRLAPAVGDVFSPKLCRTAVAASVMTKALEAVTAKYKLTENSNDALKKLAFDEANMEVARRLNHQRGVSKAAAIKRNEAEKEKKKALKEREAKVKELKEKRLERIETLKGKKGTREKIAKLKEQIKKSDERITQAKRNLKFKKENGDITGATSKASYIDPSIVAEWCSKVNLPIEKVYSKSQMKQFSQFFEN